MKTHARVAVIGGGVVGCSVLYHLTQMGWSDVVLFERSELTAGASWHAAGGMHTLNSDTNTAKLQVYTIRLYQELEERTGQSVGLHRVGGLYLAENEDRLDFLRNERAKARYLDLDSELITPEEIARLHPLLDVSHFVGALWEPADGHIDPSGVTHAFAKGARMAGAEVYRHTPVEDLVQTADGGWQVVTAQGTLTAGIVVNAAGLWGREVARMAGYDLPIVPLEHQYVVTDAIPEVAALAQEIPLTTDLQGESYMRQEGQGLVLGTYEQGCRHWAAAGTPPDFGHELLPSDLDRITDSLAVAHERVPCLANAGLKRIVNGPMIFAPDGNPVIGPVPGLSNHFVAGGVMAGFSQGAGVGLVLADWIVEGEPGMDVFAIDVARFGPHCTKGYTLEKTRENYQRRFAIAFPNEELPAGRPLKTTPVYERLKARRAVFGEAFGLEHALWFAPEGTEPVETLTFRRSNAFGPTGEEVRAVREGVGLLEIANFAKYEVTGPGAEAWLDRLLAGRLPAEGRMRLCPMLSPQGRIVGDLSVSRLGPERFMIVGSGAAESYHLRWFGTHLPGDGGVHVASATSRLVGLSLAGPRSRELLARVTPDDVSSDGLKFMRIRKSEVAMAPVLLARISFTGELGFELYMAPEYQARVFDALVAAGEDLGLRLFGARALNALRLEKSFGAFGFEYTPDYTPFQAGLDRLVDLQKPDFIGREASLRNGEARTGRCLVTLAVDAGEADAIGWEPVFHGADVVGYVTSGGYGHAVGESIALAYVSAESAEPGGGFAVEILGDKRPARLVAEPLYDPNGARMRS